MLKSINKVIKILVFSDLALLFGWGLINPILAIFIIESIKGGDTKVAGIAVGIYWLTKSILQLPVAHFLDKHSGEKDDLYFLIGGTLLASLAPIGFIFATLPWHVYLLQGVHALGMAFAIPAWSAIFTRHIDKGKEAQSWALDSSVLGLGAGAAGIIGGTVAETFGFLPLFIGVGVFGFVSAFLCLLIKKNLLPKEKVILIPKPQ